MSNLNAQFFLSRDPIDFFDLLAASPRLPM